MNGSRDEETTRVSAEWLRSNFPCMHACPVHTEAGRYVNLIAQGRYREIPYRSILALTAGLIYLVMPLDAVPDILITIGFMDDLAVLSVVIRQISHDLEAFRAWESAQEGATPAKPLHLPRVVE